MDRLIADDREAANELSLVRSVSGKDQNPQKPKTPAMPVGGQGSGGQDGGGKGGGKGGKGDEGGKGGQGAKGGKGPSSESSGSDSDSSSGRRKRMQDYEGKSTKDIPKDQTCCVPWHWVHRDGPNKGKSLCKHAFEGKVCPFPHLDKATKGIKETKMWKMYIDRNGPPNRPVIAAPAKAAAAAESDKQG